jgi:cytochrome c biogenesis protein CcmG/thiol:disulfide interchange protein DsbE
MWSSLGLAFLIAALVAVLASAKPGGNQARSPLIGKPAPAIAGKSLVGARQVSLSQYGGRWVLVNFAASWCVPCRQETPQLQQLQASGRAVVLQVAYDPNDRADLAAYLKSLGVTWPAVDDAGAVSSYGVGDIPESYLVDPQGTVIAKYFGEVSSKQLDGVIDRATQAS